MIVLPVMEREMRATARHAITYHLRILGALSLLGVLASFWIFDGGGPGAGGRLFGDFHQALFFAIWILVPLLTADCISRESREGTLPLLFLTPLSPSAVVCAKGLAHGLRSFTLWLAVLPIFTICFLGGGVDWRQVIMSALVNFSSVCLALGAGLVASTRTRGWTRALAASSFLAVLLLYAFLSLLPFNVETYGYWASKLGRPMPTNNFGTGAEAGLAMALNISSMGQTWASRSSPAFLLGAYAINAVFSAAGLVLLILLAAWNLKHTWQERPATPAMLWLKERLFKPVMFRKQLSGWLRWQLQRNPIGWLEQRSWSGRLVVWSWLAVVVCVYSSLFSNFATYKRSFHFTQTILAVLLAGSMASSAAGSFRRERETGVLELILVAPLREGQVVLGRLKGLWGQFLPSIVLLCSVWLYGATFLSERNELTSVFGFLVTFATLPMVGLYFSLSKSNFMAAFVWTILVQVVLPYAALLLLRLNDINDEGFALLTQTLVQCGIAACLSLRLLRMLRHREFVKNVT